MKKNFSRTTSPSPKETPQSSRFQKPRRSRSFHIQVYVSIGSYIVVLPSIGTFTYYIVAQHVPAPGDFSITLRPHGGIPRARRTHFSLCAGLYGAPGEMQLKLYIPPPLTTIRLAQAFFLSPPRQSSRASALSLEGGGVRSISGERESFGFPRAVGADVLVIYTKRERCFPSLHRRDIVQARNDRGIDATWREIYKQIKIKHR